MTQRYTNYKYILYSTKRVSTPDHNNERDRSDTQYHTVLKDGEFDKCVLVGKDALDKIISLSAKEWTADELRNYLKEIWKSLIERHRVLNVKTNDNPYTQRLDLKSKNISQFFAIFNTGVENEHRDEIYAVLVQTPSVNDDTTPPYSLSSFGVILENSMDIVILGKPFIQYFKNMLRENLQELTRNGKPFQNFLFLNNRDLHNGVKIALEEGLKRDDSSIVWRSTVLNEKSTDSTNAQLVGDSHTNSEIQKRVKETPIVLQSKPTDVSNDKSTNAHQVEDLCASEVEETPQTVSYEKSYNTSIILYEFPRVLNKCDDKGTNLPETYQVVYKYGGFDHCVFVTDQAYDELKRLATNERTCDRWTKESLHSYLKYIWIRLMEQHRILNARAQSEHIKELLKSGGISRTFAAFNTGLVNEDGEDIYAVLVQTSSIPDSTSPPYTLFQSGITLQHRGIFITTDETKQSKQPFIDYFKRMLKDSNFTDYYHIYETLNSTSTAMEIVLQRASFFKPRDEKLLLDWTADIECDIDHIIRRRLDRFLEVGVIDDYEAIIVDEKPDDNDTPYEVLKYAKYFNKNKYIYKYPKRTCEFYFRRGGFGINACSMLLHRWIEDAKKRVQGTFTLAVPQVYYQLNDPSQTLLLNQQYYCGKLQLLIPLFCGTNKAKLALSLDLDDSCKVDSSKLQRDDSPQDDSPNIKTDLHEVKYKASTVLRIQWAYSNARLLAAPQATWILQPEDLLSEVV